MKHIVFGIISALMICPGSVVLADQVPPMENRDNLALGKKVIYSPEPNNPLTKQGLSDAMDLTDGKISDRADHKLWYESSAVGWEYMGRVNLAVDLGKNCDIEEIAIRLQNGSMPSGGLHFPGWVEAFLSDDGEHYVKVAEFTRWNTGEFQRFGIAQKRGHSYVDCLRFKNVNSRGRYVGLRIYGNDTMVSDELYVFGKPAEGRLTAKPGRASGFTVTHPQIYFHKPYLELATNISLPVPIGADMPSTAGSALWLKIELPDGVEIVGGEVGGEKAASGRTTFTLSTQNARTDKVYGRLYMKAGRWKEGAQGELRYSFGNGQWDSGWVNLPIRAVEVPAAPRLKRIMTSMGWWMSAKEGAAHWPDELKAFETLGLNTFNVFGAWMPENRKDPQWLLLDEARKQGFFISNLDSPIHPIVNDHRDAKEIYDQFEDGTVGGHLCVSYRGKYYKEEIARFAKMMASIKPDFSSQDIEVWNWAGPTENVKCTRCQADYAASGSGSWAKWQQSKGTEMIQDLITAARQAVRESGGNPDFSTGCYAFRPGEVYQQVFDFSALYPNVLQNSEVSTYTSLEPADVELVGDETGRDRSRLPRSDVMPWNTPGDGGVFPGEAFQWSLLENYCNGAKGVWFWSWRVWDSEDLIAYNRVIRAIAPVEDVIVNGEPVGADAAVVGAGRVRGMKHGDHMVLLVTDYFLQAGGRVKLEMTLAGESRVHDLMSGRIVTDQLPAGRQTMEILLNGERARLLQIVPVQ